MLTNEQLHRYAELEELIETKTAELKALNAEYETLANEIVLECMSVETYKFSVAELGNFTVKGGLDAMHIGVLKQNRETVLDKLFPEDEEKLAFAASQINGKTVGTAVKEVLKKDFMLPEGVDVMFYHKVKFTPFKVKPIVL